MPAESSRAVFLSYASQDAEAARRICAALRAAGVEVWFDQSELVGGDAWDQKIRRQIKECALFVPIISANTNARREGYFRREWKLAVDRTNDMDEGLPFLIPVVIDATTDGGAFVPEKFREVQWTRLAAGEASPAFCARVRKLLDGSAGVPPAIERVAGGTPALPGKKRRWLAPAVIGFAAVIAVTAWYVFSRSPSKAPNSKPKTQISELAASAAPPPQSEAQKLIAQMWTIYDNVDDTSAEEWTLAEELGAQATKLEPLNAEAWAAYANVSIMRYVFGFDADRTRIDRAIKIAERAVSLAPASTNAQLALANCYRVGGDATIAEAERIARALAAREPTNRRVLRMAGNVMKYARKYDDAVAYYDRAIALPGNDHLTLLSKENVLKNAGRYAEAEDALDRSFALHPGPAASVRKLFYLVMIRDDLDAAADLITKVPGHLLLRDYGAYHGALLWLWRHETEKCIALLRRFDRDELYGTPVGYLIGQAYEAAGQHAAAEVEWRAALKKIDAKLAALPNDFDRIYWKAFLLALLGDQTEAERLLKIYLQMTSGGTNKLKYFESAILVPLGRRDEVLDSLEEGVTAPTLQDFVNWRGGVRHDPIYDPLRNTPRFQAALAKLNARLMRGAPSVAKTDDNSASTDKSIAVLAFKTIGDDKEGEYFSEGISEELMNVLAKVPGLRVTGSTSAFYFKGKQVPLAEIAKQLGVAYIVEGSVRKMGSRVRITATLVKAADGFQIWASENLERELKDIFAVQDEIAGLIAKSLQLTLGAVPRATRTVNPDAHRLVFEGRHYWKLRGDANLALAETAYLRALEIDSQFAQAHAGLADVWTIRAWYHELDGGGAQIAQDFVRAKAEVQRARELDSSLAEPYASLGTLLFIEHKFAEAEEQFARAFALNPNYAVAHHWHSILAFSRGQIERAVEDLRRSLRLDPLSPMPMWTLAGDLNFAQQAAEALQLSERSLQLRPDFSPVLAEKAISCWILRRPEEAIATAREIVRNFDTSPVRWWCDSDAIHLLRQAGLEAEAKAHGERVFARTAPGDYRRAYVLAALGRGREALEALSELPTVAFIRLYLHPMWDPVRDDPRFQQTLARLGCAEEYKVARETMKRMRKESAAK